MFVEKYDPTQTVSFASLEEENVRNNYSAVPSVQQFLFFMTCILVLGPAEDPFPCLSV